MVTSSNTDTGMEFDLCHFNLKSSVYITSTTVEFSVVCYFASSKRWQNLKTPTAGSSVSITGKIAGRTIDGNNLAIRVLDLSYLPSSFSSHSSTSTLPQTSIPSKHANRWSGRPEPTTPSKKLLTSPLPSSLPSSANIDTNTTRPSRNRHSPH